MTFWHLVYLIRRLTLVWFLIQQVNMFISSCMNRIIYFVLIMIKRQENWLLHTLYADSPDKPTIKI